MCIIADRTWYGRDKGIGGVIYILKDGKKYQYMYSWYFSFTQANFDLPNNYPLCHFDCELMIDLRCFIILSCIPFLEYIFVIRILCKTIPTHSV